MNGDEITSGVTGPSATSSKGVIPPWGLRFRPGEERPESVEDSDRGALVNDLDGSFDKISMEDSSSPFFL